ncbi:NEW3 domain-containing protein [Paenibacillus sp. 1P07SE]|uniref:COG1470 family protein n=1 Tax=Paenibacillus sp. 1P07SE TaxID=3132209 RepID=UPI0039A5B124
MYKTWRSLGLAMLAMVLAWTGSAAVWTPAVHAAGELELYTPYTALDAAPGESITYDVELINHTALTRQADVVFHDEGSGWQSELTAGGRGVKQLAVRPDSPQSLSLRLEVPLEIERGEYNFRLTAGDAALPLKVFVTEKGTYTTKLEAEQANIQGHADASFTFSTSLRNQTAEEQTYALAASPEAGWEVTFKAGGNSVTSVTVEPNASQTITVEALPPDHVEAGTYKLPIAAANHATRAETTLEAVVTGSYGIGLATADERLNAEVRSGGTRTLDLIVSNTGTAALEDISLSAQTPTNWEVTFEPKTIQQLEPGMTANVQAVIRADEQSIPGDYALSMSASSPQKSANAALRVAVKSSSLWGWIGVLIIAAVALGIYGLFRRYGRR